MFLLFVSVCWCVCVFDVCREPLAMFVVMVSLAFFGVLCVLCVFVDSRFFRGESFGWLFSLFCLVLFVCVLVCHFVCGCVAARCSFFSLWWGDGLLWLCSVRLSSACSDCCLLFECLLGVLLMVACDGIGGVWVWAVCCSRA